MLSPLCEGLSAGITAAAWVDRESLLVRVVLSYPSSDLEVVCGCGPSVGWFHLGWSLVPEGGASAAARSRIVVGVAAVVRRAAIARACCFLLHRLIFVTAVDVLGRSDVRFCPLLILRLRQSPSPSFSSVCSRRGLNMAVYLLLPPEPPDRDPIHALF